MPNEFDAALSYFTPDPKALAEARKKRLKTADSYEQGYREGQQMREEQERAAKLQLQEQERLDKERAQVEAEQADLERKQRLAETERTYARAGRPTRTDAMGEIFPVDDDETWQRKQDEKKVAEDLKAQSRADAAYRKSQAVQLNQAETKLKAGLDDFDTAEVIGSQAVSAKASQIISLSQQIKHLSDNAVSEDDLAKLDTMQQALFAARKEKELLENSERTLKVAKLNKEQELKPALNEIQQKRDVLPITTAPAIPKGAGVTLQNTVSTATPTPASADPERAAAVLRTQITALREKGDYTRADALERRLVNPAKWEAEQKAFRQTATPEQLAQSLEAGSADIAQQWQATQQTYAVLSQQRQAYLARLEQASAKNATLLDQPYSDADVAIIRDETTGQETRWHKAAAEQYNSALQGLNGWQQANQEKIDLLDLNRQQLQIEAENLRKHENQLRYLGREQQRQQDGEKATYLNNLRQTPGMAEFADEFERTELDYNQRKGELERKYPDPQVRDIANKAMQEDFSARSKDMHERIAAREQEVGNFYRDWGSSINTDDWQTEASVTPRLQQEAAKRGMTEQQARQVLDTSRKLDWSRPLPDDAKGARKLPDGQITVSPTLYLEPAAYEKAVDSTDASPEAKKAALAQRRDLAAPMAAEMLLDLQKVPEFAEYLAQKTRGTPVERMEQFQADLREGGALAASLQRFQGGASSLASSALGAAAAITGSDYLRSQGERFQQRAQAFETAGAEGAKGTNAVLGFGSKVIGAAPSMLGAMVPGGLLARLGQVAKLSSVAINRAALTGAALGSGAQSFGGTYLDAVQAFEKKGMSPTEAHGKALSAALLSGSVTTALTALSGLRGAESLLAQKELVKKTLVARAKEIGIGIADEALEEGVDQLAQGIIAQQTYAPQKKIGDILSESLEAALIGGVLGGGMTALSEGVDAMAGRQELLAEDLAAAEVEIENYQDPTADPAEVEARKSRASLAQAIARGVGLDGIEETILNSAGWTRKDKDGVTRADGTLTKIKDYTGPNVLDVDSAGKVKLDKTYVAKLAEVMPTVAGLVGSKQTTWHKPGQIEDKAPASPSPSLPVSGAAVSKSSSISPVPASPAPSAKPSSGEVGPRTPAGTSQTRGTSAQGAAAVTDLDTAGKTQAAAPAVSGAAADSPVQITNVADLVKNGGGVVSVTENGRQVSFDKFAIAIDGTTAEIAFVELSAKERGKGFGKAAYIALGNALAAQGITLQSSKAQYKDGRALWQSLAKAGFATLGPQGVYTFTAPASNTKQPAYNSEEAYQKAKAAALAAHADAKEAVSALLPTYTAGDPRPQRAWEIANHLEMAGLDRPTANLVAANAIRFQGIVGKTVNEQVTSKEFNTFLDEQGATGDRSTREGTEPLKISQPTASQEKATSTPAPALQTSKSPVKKPEPQSPVRPEYAALRDRLKSKDISTVDAVREVIRLSGETDTGVLQDLLTDHLGLKKPSAAAAVETLRAAGELKGPKNDDISLASSPKTPQNSGMASDSGAAQSNDPSPGGLSEAESRKILSAALKKRKELESHYTSDAHDVWSESDARENLESELDREPSPEEVADYIAKSQRQHDDEVKELLWEHGTTINHLVWQQIAEDALTSLGVKRDGYSKKSEASYWYLPGVTAENGDALGDAYRIRVASHDPVYTQSDTLVQYDLREILDDNHALEQAIESVNDLKKEITKLNSSFNPSRAESGTSLAAGKRASDRQPKPSDKAYTATKEFIPATQGALAENPAWARAKLSMLARTPPARRRWTYRFLTQIENTISQRAGLYDAFAVGQTARQALEGNKIAVVPIQGKTTLAIDLDRMLADFSYLGDPRAAAVATVMEEDIHAAQFRLMAKGGRWTKSSLAQQWRILPESLQKTVWQAYNAANPGKAMPKTWSDNTAFQMQSEFLRMLVQGRIDPKSITEAVDASPGLIQSIKDLLADLYDTLRSLIKGLPVSQAVTLDQQVTELKAALEQLGKPSTAEELRTKLFLRDPSALAMQALKNGTVFDQLATQDALFTPQGLARVWDLLTPEMRAQVERLKKTAAPWLSKKRTDNAALTRDLLTFLLDPRAAQALAQANLTGSPAASASTGMVRRALRAMSDYFRSARPDFAQTLGSLDLTTAQVLQQMQSLLVNARAQFEASAAVQKLPTLVTAEPQADDEDLTGPPSPAQLSARAMVEAWMQEAQQQAFLDQAAAIAEQMMPGVSDAIQRRAIARQMAGRTWDALKARMEAIASGSPSPSLQVSGAAVSQSSPLALPSPAMRSAQAIDEALTSQENLAQQNTSPEARDAIARRLMQEEWSAAILSTVANAERRYYLNQRELSPEQLRQIESLLQVAAGDLTLGWQADRRQIGQSPDSGAPVRQMGLSRENALAVLGIRIGSDGTAYAAANAPVYIEGGTILIKQTTLDDLSQTLPITRRQFRLSEDEQRARIGLRGTPQPVTAATVAEARAADQQQQDTSKVTARLEQLEAQERAAEKTSVKPVPLIDPNADPKTGKLHRGERGDLISWLGDHGSLGWPDSQAGGEWDWFLDLLGDYYNAESTGRTRKKALRDSKGNVIGIKDAAVQGTKLGMTNTAKRMAREGNLTTPAAIVEYLIQEGVVTPAIPTEDGSPRNLTLHENVGDRTGIDAIEEAAREANHDLPDGIGNAVMTALDGREAARTNRQNDPERAAELQTLRFERDTRSGPVVVPAHELAPLSEEGTTFITARSQDGDLIPLDVASYEWQPIDPESAEADDYLEGHPAWRQSLPVSQSPRSGSQSNLERLVITLRGGTYYGQQTIPGDTLLRVEDAGNTGIGMDLGDGKSDFVTDEDMETPVETLETENSEPETENEVSTNPALEAEIYAELRKAGLLAAADRLRPAIRNPDGKIVVGRPGELHFEIARRDWLSTLPAWQREDLKAANERFVDLVAEDKVTFEQGYHSDKTGFIDGQQATQYLPDDLRRTALLDFGELNSEVFDGEDGIEMRERPATELPNWQEIPEQGLVTRFNSQQPPVRSQPLQFLINGKPTPATVTLSNTNTTIQPEGGGWKTEYHQAHRGGRSRRAAVDEFAAALLNPQAPFWSTLRNQNGDTIRPLASSSRLPVSAEGVSQSPSLSASDRFYSQLARTVEAKMPNRADAKTLRGILENPQNRVKAEELKWSGLLAWADSQPQPLTKQQVLDYLATEGSVRFEETRLGDTPAEYETVWKIKENGADAYPNVFRTRQDAIDEIAAVEGWTLAESGYEIVPVNRQTRPPRQQQRNTQWTLPGGENHREVVVSMESYPVRFQKWAEARGIDNIAEAEQAFIKQYGQSPQQKFASPNSVNDKTHYGDLDALAWFRANDRDNGQGLLVEEFQSKWHQQGREKGYQNDALMSQEAKDEFDAVSSIDRRERTPAQAQRYRELSAQWDNYRANGGKGVPDAPYRSAWPLMLFKRALADAVAEGKQWIGWTTGDTQADRYDLSKQVDRIDYGTPDGQDYVLTIYKSGQEIGESMGLPDSIPAKDLEKYVGKEIAQRILSGQPSGSLTGSDLRVGGEGMRKFYDDILVKEFGKYVKPWGGKVEKSSTYTGPSEAEYKPLGYRIKPVGEQFGVFEPGNPRPMNPVQPTEQAAQEFIDRLEAIRRKINADYQTPIWRIDITPQMRESVAAGQALFAADRLRDIADDEANAAYAAGVRTYYDYLVRMKKLVLKADGFDAFKPYMRSSWSGIADKHNLPEPTRALAEAAYFRLARQKSPAPGGISQPRPQGPTPRQTPAPATPPAPTQTTADLEWEMGLSDNPTPDPYVVPPGRRVVPRDEAPKSPTAPEADDQQAEIDATIEDPNAPKVAELGFDIAAHAKDKKKKENIAKLKEIIEILKARPDVPKNSERIAKLEQRLEKAIEELIQARGATLEQRQQAIDEVYGPLAPSVTLRNTTTSDGSVVPHIMRGRALMVDLAGVPHVATKQVALTSVGTGHAPGVRFLPLAGDKSNWTGFINDTVKKVAPNLDAETDLYLEPYGGGLVYLQNLSFLQRTSKPVMIAVSREYEPERFAIYSAIARNDERVMKDLRQILKDLNHTPTTKEGEDFVTKLWGKVDKRSHTAASQEAFEQLPNLASLLQKPNVKLMPWSDAETFRAAIDRATKGGKRVTLLEDSNYADLFGEDTANQYATQDDHPELPGFGQAKTEFIGKDPAKLLAQKLPVYRAVLGNGGTIIATNNMNHTLLGGLLSEFGDQGHWFGYAHRTRPVKDGWLRHLDGKGVLWSTERPEYLAILRQSGVTTAPKYGTETPNGYDYRAGPRRSAAENNRAAEPRREPSPHTGGSLAAAELLRQQIADMAGAGPAGTSEQSLHSESPAGTQSGAGSQPSRTSALERTAAPLPEGAKASALEVAQWDADQREQRDLDQQFDTLEDELGNAADEAMGENETGLASSDKSLPSVAPTLDLRYTTTDGQDPQTTRRSPLEGDQSPSTGTSPSVSRRLPAQASDMLAWAKENGWLIDTDDLVQRIGIMAEIDPGDEHDVWFDELTHRAVKLTKDTNGTPDFVAGSPAAYLLNLRRQNAQFDTGFTFEGIVDDNGTPRFVISQPWITGTPATQEAKEAYFKAKGFDPAGPDTFYSIGQDLLVSDARAANVVQRADGSVQPIDLQIREVSPRQAEMWENRVAAYGRLSSSDRKLSRPYLDAIEKAGIRPAISVNGKPYTGRPGMFHIEILGHYIWKNIYTAQQRRDDPNYIRATRFGLNDWMDRKDSGFDNFGYLTTEGKFIDREQAFDYVEQRGLQMPKGTWSTNDRSLNSEDLLRLASSERRPMTAAEATAAGYTLKAYRGVSRQTPFNESDTVWATTNRDVAESYATEVFSYDDPDVVELRINPTGIPRTDIRQLSDEQREAMAVDSFGNPQKIGIYANSDDSPLGSSYPQTALHVPKSATLVKKADGLFHPLAGAAVSQSPRSVSESILAAAQKTNTSPSEAQIEAENYQTGKVTVHGLRLSIENPAGSVRKGTDANGKAWEVTMPHHYGRILGTTGADKDHVDFFLGPDPASPMAFVVNQKKPGNGHFDEHKVMLGFTNPGTAARGYLDSYSKGWRGYDSIVPMTIPQIKHWLEHGKMGEAVTKAPVVSNDTAKPKATRPATTHTLPDGYQLTGSGLHLLPASIRAYHGTPHEIDPREGFRTSKIGTGEGAQAYGWGLYFAESFDVADDYRGKLQNEFRIGFNGKTLVELYPGNEEAVNLQNRLESIAKGTQYGSQGEQVRKAFLGATYGDLSSKAPPTPGVLFARQVEKDYGNRIRTETGGNLYTVELLPDEDEFLDWDKPLSEQSEKVKAALMQTYIRRTMPLDENGVPKAFAPNPAGEKLYAFVGGIHGEEFGSKFLRDAGIPGIRYLDQSSRNLYYDLTTAQREVRSWEHEVKVMNSPAAKAELEKAQAKLAKAQSNYAAATHNYVIFDDKLVKIIERNGQPIDTPALASSNKQPLPAAPDMDDYQTWGKDKATRDSEWKRYRADRAKWEAKVAEFASKQGNLGTFLAPLKSYPSGQAYREARTITRVPGDATRWRATIFGQQPITATSIPVGDWANNAWVPVAHNEFETKAEAYQSSANAMPEGYTFSTQPLFAANRTTLAAAPRFVEQASRASFNHLDRWFTGTIARQAKRVTSSDPVTAATQAAAAWWNQDTPGVSTLRSLKELAQRELLPETVLPREIMSAMREMQIKQSMGQQKALDVGRALSDKPKFSDLHYPPEFVENPMHREAMFSAMEQGKVDTLPPALQEVAKKLRQMLVEAGREAVKQGRMNPDTFEGLRTNFMPRFTKEEAQASAGDFAKRFKLGVKDILAQRSTAFHITDTSRKDKNGLPQIVSHARGKWRFDSQQARDAYYEDLINRQTLDGDLAKNDMHWMNRGDARALRSITPEMLKTPATMTKDQRDVVARVQRQLRNQFKREDPYEPKDLVKDPVYAVMRYLAQMTHDNAVAEFFNVIDTNPDWTSTTEMKGFTQIPDNDRFGALAGKFVRKDIADQVMELAHTPAQVIQLYDTLLRLWKTGKTVLNPATHARNIIGNLPFAQFAGNNALNPANWTHYAHAMRTLREGGDEYRQLYETGVLGADYASTELRAALENIVPVVQEDDSTNPIRHLIALGNRAAQWGKAHSLANVATLGSVGATAGFIAAGPLGALAGAGIAAAANPIYRAALWAYRLEDDLFKAAAFFKARSMGMTLEQAAQHVRDWFPYYDKPTSTTLKFAGRTTMPFLSFFRESARIGAKAAKERPLSLAATLAIPALITAYSAAKLGLDDEDKEDVKAGMRGKGAKLLGMTPLAGVPIFSMLIPWRTSSGQLQQIDLSSTYPFADFLANRVENWNNDPWWQAWSRSALANPMLGALYTAATGRDPFGDRTLWDSSYTSDEKAKAILGHAWKTAMPPLTPGGTNWTMIEQSTRRQANKTLALRSPAQAVGRGVFGIDVRTAEPDIYSLADAFRKRRGLPVTEGNTAYPTDAAGRARKALFEELVQPQPDPKALAKLLQSLNDLGKPVRTVADVLDILDYRRPDGVINPKELRAPFRASLAPEARRVLDTALKEFQRARAATPGAFAKARQQIKPTTRAPITEP